MNEKLAKARAKTKEKLPLNKLGNDSHIAEAKETQSKFEIQTRHHRKRFRLDIAQKTIRYSFIGLAISIVFVVIILAFDPRKLDLYIYFISGMISSLFSVLTLALGFVAGSSID